MRLKRLSASPVSIQTSRVVRFLNKLLRPTRFSLIYFNTWNALNISGQPVTLIDIGCAYDTPQFRDAFPSAQLFLVDPVREYEPHMRSAVEKRGGAYAITAVGAERATVEITVNVDDPEKSSVYERTPLARKPGRTERRTCDVVPLDELVLEHALKPPFGIKIDTEGYELEVIKGATKTLRDALFVITEASIQRRFVGSYDFETLLSEMTRRGFQVVNILSAEPDGQGLVRFVDVLFAPTGEGPTSA